MLTALFVSAEFTESPILATAVILSIAFGLASIVIVYQAWQEGRSTRLTTSAELRKDTETATRQERLRVLQGGRGSRSAS